MARREMFDVRDAQGKEADGRVEAAAILRVKRALELLFQVDEGPGDLDEAFEKPGVRTCTPEPEVLKHIVGLVVFSRVEAFKVRGVRDRKVPAGGASAQDGLQPLMFGNSRRPRSVGKLSPVRIALQAF